MKCFVLGNGPSLMHVHNDVLRKLTVFGSNRIYMKYVPDYYACVNSLMAEQSRTTIEELPCMKYVTDTVSIKSAMPLHSTAGDFSLMPLESVWECGSVTIVLLQLALWFGYDTVYLLGVDHNYQYVGEPNAAITWQGFDVNHFHPGYMKEGEKWNVPDLYASEQGYMRCRQVFEEAGGRIINCTEGSKLGVFEKGDISSIIA